MCEVACFMPMQAGKVVKLTSKYAYFNNGIIKNQFSNANFFTYLYISYFKMRKIRIEKI